MPVPAPPATHPTRETADSADASDTQFFNSGQGRATTPFEHSVRTSKNLVKRKGSRTLFNDIKIGNPEASVAQKKEESSPE